MSRPKFFRDPIHLQMRFEAYDALAQPSGLTGGQRLSWILQKSIDTVPFQRLRGIRQNGLANLVFHGAEHSRFSHSLGVSHLARVMYERICRNMSAQEDEEHKLQVAMAGLVHDVGHGPFSHTLEEILREADGSFHHESMTKRFILEDDSEINGVVREIDNQLPTELAKFFDKKRLDDHWRYRIVSSQLDADRLDYTQRDAAFSGIRGHGFDIERLLDLLYVHNEVSLAVDRGGIESVEAYLVTLDHLWRSIYYHHAVRAATKGLTSLFKRAVYLYRDGNKSVFSSRSLREHPFQRLLVDGESIPLDIYVRLGDVAIWELVDFWQDSDDPVLENLSTRLVRRELFKTLDFDPTDVAKFLDLKEHGEEATKEFLGDPSLVDYYFFIDSPDRTSYKTYDWKPESPDDSIWMTGGDMQDRPIEENDESVLVGALKKRRDFNRFIMLDEVRKKLLDR